MQTKEYLSQISRLDRMIQNKLGEINQLKTIACNVTTPNDGERVQTSPDKDKVGAIVAKIVDMEKEVDGMIAKRGTIVSQIDSMEDENFYDILAKRYILKKDLKVIAVERKVSFRYMRSVHSQALRAFEDKYSGTFEN